MSWFFPSVCDVIVTYTESLERGFQSLLSCFEFSVCSVLQGCKRCTSEEKWTRLDFFVFDLVMYFFPSTYQTKEKGTLVFHSMLNFRHLCRGLKMQLPFVLKLWSSNEDFVGFGWNAEIWFISGCCAIWVSSPFLNPLPHPSPWLKWVPIPSLVIPL